MRSRQFCRLGGWLQTFPLGCVVGFPIRARLEFVITLPLLRSSVRNLSGWSAFLLVTSLPSTVSASHGVPCPLFDDFFGTMVVSDFPSAFIAALSPWGSRHGPLRLEATDGISRFPFNEFTCMHRVSDHAGAVRLSHSDTAVLPSG